MTDWRERANCRTADPELFFADSIDTHNDKTKQLEKDARIDQAKALCVACPVRLICLDAAHARNEKDGIWGGLDPKQREKERRQRPNPPARCGVCGAHYQRRSNGQRYCGTNCAGEAHRQAQVAYDRRNRDAHREYMQRRRETAA